jgi:hypothetical protein
MPIYRVMKCNPVNDGDWQRVEAESCQLAAEKVCGVPLRTTGTLGELRARVHPDGRPEKKQAFFAKLGSI